MPKFSLERRIPSCLVTTDLLSALEVYLNGEMCQKLGEVLGDEIQYQISIKEKIGTEILAGVREYTPSAFSDGTNEIEIRWSNRYRAACRLDIAIDFDSDYFLSRLKVDCTAPTARETAIGIGHAIMRLLESHRTYNWLFNPFKIPIVTIVAGPLALGLLVWGSTVLPKNREWGLGLVSGAVLLGWIYFSAGYFRPFISFDSRRQKLLDRLWRYFSLGTFGFVFFGTLLPLVRKFIVGF